MTTHSAAPEPSRSLLDRVFGVVTERRTYANIAYLLLRFPLGIAYFTILVTGFAVGIALVPLVVGVPILAGVLALTPYLAAIESSLLDRFFGLKMSVDPLDPSEMSLVSFLKAAVTEPRHYGFAIAFFASFPLGIGVFTLVVTVLSIAAVLVFTPVLFWLPVVDYRIVTVGSSGPTIVIDTLPEALVASVVGIALGLVALHLFNLLARGLGSAIAVLFAGQNR